MAPPPPLPPFEDVYRDYGDRILRFCITQLRDSATAEDVAADVFTAAFVAYERVRPDPDTVHIWLFRIARNKIVSHRRRELVLHRILPGLRGTEETDDSVEQRIVVRDELRRALEAARQLGKRDRELVGLRVGALLGYGEIGALMGMSEHAAMVATSRALEKLRRMAGPRS